MTGFAMDLLPRMTQERRVNTNRGGRPRKGQENPPSKHIRVAVDLAEMISWISEAEKISSATFLDPILRKSVEQRYARLYSAIRSIKQGQDAAALETGRELTPELPQLRTVDPDSGEEVTLEELATRQDRRKKPRK